MLINDFIGMKESDKINKENRYCVPGVRTNMFIVSHLVFVFVIVYHQSKELLISISDLVELSPFVSSSFKRIIVQ